MDRLAFLHETVFAEVERRLDGLIPLLARVVFAATLLVYFWASAATKLGDGLMGIFLPSTGAYAQIFPKQMEAVLYDVSQLGVFHWAVVVAGTWAEFILPLLVVIGLFTRLAALGMIGFRGRAIAHRPLWPWRHCPYRNAGRVVRPGTGQRHSRSAGLLDVDPCHPRDQGSRRLVGRPDALTVGAGRAPPPPDPLQSRACRLSLSCRTTRQR